MKKLLAIGGSSLLLLVALLCGAFFAGPLLASAHGTTTTATKPTTTKKTTPAEKREEHPLRVFVRNHKGEIVEQIAPQLHLTTEQLTDKLQHGQRLVDIAKDQKISRASLKTLIEKSVDTVINQQVSAGKLDQKYAALLKTLVEKHPFVTARVLHHQYTVKK